MKVGSEATDKKFKAKDNYTTTLQPLNTSSTKGQFSPNHRGIGILKGTQSYEVSIFLWQHLKNCNRYLLVNPVSPIIQAQLLLAMSHQF